MKKFIFSDNGTLTDYSTELENYHSGSAVIDFTQVQDAIYIGSELPFNSLFVDLTVLNIISSTPTLSYWDGSTWREVVDLDDETSELFASGYLTWVTDKNHNWVKEDTVSNTGSERITGLGNVTIYDMYWLKLTYDTTITATTKFNWIGPKFCTSDDVESEHTMFGVSAFKSNYESGKTDWEQEIVIASSLIVEELIDMAVITDGSQLLERRKLKHACVSKVAEIIFSNLGDDYENDRLKSRNEYKSRIKKKNYRVDVNKNARVDEREKGVTTGGLYR